MAGGVLAALNAREGDPLTHRPDMIGQASRHRRCSLPPVPSIVTFLERSYRPAKIITVHSKIGHRLVDPPVLTERVGLAHLPGVVVPVGGVLSLQKRGVDPSAHLRLRQ